MRTVEGGEERGKKAEMRVQGQKNDYTQKIWVEKSGRGRGKIQRTGFLSWGRGGRGLTPVIPKHKMNIPRHTLKNPKTKKWGELAKERGGDYRNPQSKRLKVL